MFGVNIRILTLDSSALLRMIEAFQSIEMS